MNQPFFSKEAKVLKIVYTEELKKQLNKLDGVEPDPFDDVGGFLANKRGLASEESVGKRWSRRKMRERDVTTRSRSPSPSPSPSRTPSPLPPPPPPPPRPVGIVTGEKRVDTPYPECVPSRDTAPPNVPKRDTEPIFIDLEAFEAAEPDPISFDMPPASTFTETLANFLTCKGKEREQSTPPAATAFNPIQDQPDSNNVVSENKFEPIEIDECADCVLDLDHGEEIPDEPARLIR